MLPDISVYPAHTCIRKHYESEAYNMELFDILQTAEEVSGIDMKAVLQAMGISVNVKEHTEAGTGTDLFVCIQFHHPSCMEGG